MSVRKEGMGMNRSREEKGNGRDGEESCRIQSQRSMLRKGMVGVLKREGEETGVRKEGREGKETVVLGKKSP